MACKKEYIKTESTKVVEQYLEVLDTQRAKLDTERISVFMQVGDFFEIYGIQYPDGSTKGNLWDLSNDLILKIGKKETAVYGRKDISCYMAGVPIPSLNKYLNTAVEFCGWTIVLIEQEKTETSIERYISGIISPGLNTHSSQETNNLMVIYLEKVASLLHKGEHTLYAGISYIDCLTGESGIIQYPYKHDVSSDIIYDEILKLITITNPSEIIFYADKCGLKESEIVNQFHLNTIVHRIYIDETPKLYFDKE